MTHPISSLVLVGAPPPPFHGQAVVTQNVFELNFGEVDVKRCNLRFSENINEVGSFGLSKLKVLCKGGIQLLIYRLCFLGKNPVLYYCAGSANWIPLLKDFVLLGIVGRLYSRRVVHFHSGGLPEWFQQNRLAQVIGFFTYAGIARSIALTHAVQVPVFGKTEKLIVRNGLFVDEVTRADFNQKVEEDREVRFLYLGSLIESKGVGLIIEAAQYLQNMDFSDQQNWSITFAGKWANEKEKAEWDAYILTHNLGGVIKFVGQVVGSEKWQLFKEHDVFIFPSFYPNENQPLVLIEAMGSSLPIIASRWRGIPEMIDEGEYGIFIESNSPDAVSSAMSKFLDSKFDFDNWRLAARKRYEEDYSLERFGSQIWKSICQWD